ncbi:MAG: HAMP domain-containing histidine kinase [Anaerolineales bacterium]|nr:HAMP domain-containing histidine kinase [Anaerolineales bacterium]
MSLRARLIFGYSALLAAILFLFGGSLYVILRSTLTIQIDQVLQESAADILKSMAVRSVDDLKYLTLPPLPFPSANAYVQVWNARGALLSYSPNMQSVMEPLDPEALPRSVIGTPLSYGPDLGAATATLEYTPLAPEEARFSDAMIRGLHLRVFTQPIWVDGEYLGLLEIGTPMTMVDRTLSILFVVLSVGGVSAVLLSILIGNWIALGALQPLETVTAAAIQITHADDLSRRIPLKAPASSEVGRLIQAFNDTLERLEGLFSAQSRFLADVSHELRTPLTSIRGNVDLIRRMGPDAESLDSVQSEVDRMSRLVGDLLMLSRAEAGTLPLVKKPVEMDTLLLEVMEQAVGLAQGKVEVCLGNLEQASVVGDRDRLKQLLLNLVVNAMQYTQAGGRVVLSLRVFEDCLHMTVSDNGPGIPADELPHIFDRFYRVDKSRSRGPHGGSGLGLSIAQWIAHGHDGRIEVASEPGKGTTFSVWLPLGESDIRSSTTDERSSARSD